MAKAATTTTEEIQRWIHTLHELQDLLKRYPELNAVESDHPEYDTSEIIDFLIYRMEKLWQKQQHI
jgi:hypothetical protein